MLNLKSVLSNMLLGDSHGLIYEFTGKIEFFVNQNLRSVFRNCLYFIAYHLLSHFVNLTFINSFLFKYILIY